jgi:hypothetical protein
MDYDDFCRTRARMREKIPENVKDQIDLLAGVGDLPLAAIDDEDRILYHELLISILRKLAENK